jgi:hypothetical protein
MGIPKEIHDKLSSGDESAIWSAAVEAGEFIETEPHEVWELVKQFGSEPDPELKDAIATCVLEHLLEYHFNDFFGQLEEEVKSGNFELGETFMRCWKFGQSKLRKNSLRWKKLETFVWRVREEQGR